MVNIVTKKIHQVTIDIAGRDRFTEMARNEESRTRW